MGREITLAKVLILFCCMSIYFSSCEEDNLNESKITVTDIDGNIYETVVIGDQIWMAENLRTTCYANGIEISLVEDSIAWDNLEYSDKAYCYYDNSLTYAEIHGALYTWPAAINGVIGSDNNPSNIQGICPDGWHLPSNAEWEELIEFIRSDGYQYNVGIALKSTTGWDEGGNGTDVYGFNAIPSGTRFMRWFVDEKYTHFWSSTEFDEYSGWSYNLSPYNNLLKKQDGYAKNNGFSVRCVRD